jgi:hypothetical protein
VVFRVERGEADALREGLTKTHPVEHWAISTELLEGGTIEGDAELWLELVATSEDDAEATGREIYARARLAGYLAPAEPQLLGFLGPPVPDTLDQELADNARHLMDAGHNALAVVRAHTACEVLARLALTKLLERRGVPDGATRSVVRGAALTSDMSRAVFTMLTGEHVEHQPWWADYTAHTTRRNAVLHRGLAVTSEQAQESLDVCATFRDYVEVTCARARGATGAR